jgi:hypothetical protein
VGGFDLTEVTQLNMRLLLAGLYTDYHVAYLIHYFNIHQKPRNLALNPTDFENC